MYRTLLPILLYVSAARAAPQDTEITYVKMLPITVAGADGKQTRESRIENLPLTIPGIITRPTRELAEENISKTNPLKENLTETVEKSDNVRRVRSDSTTSSYESETTEPPDSVTDRDTTLEEAEQTVEYEARTKAPSPRFLSKLSYFQKPDDVHSSIATNFVERNGKKRFRSKCRCEKIWNCPKLQITVPRCPNDYFLCCF